MKTIQSLLTIAIVAVGALRTPLFAAVEPETGFKSLFNGEDLTGWEGNPRFWSVKDGCITGQTTAENPSKGNTFLIYQNGYVRDFELRLSYKIVGGNSGIQYRSQDLGNWIVSGYQGDLEAGKTYSGVLYEERGRGILAHRGQKTVIKPAAPDSTKHMVEVVGDTGKSSEELQAAIKNEDWNEYVIIAKGNHLTHSINGNVTADAVDEHSALAAKSGILALQLHAGPPMTVQFKNIRIKPLK